MAAMVALDCKQNPSLFVGPFRASRLSPSANNESGGGSGYSGPHALEAYRSVSVGTLLRAREINLHAASSIHLHSSRDTSTAAAAGTKSARMNEFAHSVIYDHKECLAAQMNDSSDPRAQCAPQNRHLCSLSLSICARLYLRPTHFLQSASAQSTEESKQLVRRRRRRRRLCCWCCNKSAQFPRTKRKSRQPTK